MTTEFRASAITGPMPCVACHAPLYYLPPFGLYERHYRRMTRGKPEWNDIATEYRPHVCTAKMQPLFRVKQHG